MKVLTDFIEIAVNFFQGIMLTYFAYAVLGSKKRAGFSFIVHIFIFSRL